MGKKLNLQLKKKFANPLEGEPDKNVYANLNNIHVGLLCPRKHHIGTDTSNLPTEEPHPRATWKSTAISIFQLQIF